MGANDMDLIKSVLFKMLKEKEPVLVTELVSEVDRVSGNNMKNPMVRYYLDKLSIEGLCRLEKPNKRIEIWSTPNTFKLGMPDYSLWVRKFPTGTKLIMNRDASVYHGAGKTMSICNYDSLKLVAQDIIEFLEVSNNDAEAKIISSVSLLEKALSDNECIQEVSILITCD